MEYAEKLLLYFVKQYSTLYGECFMSYNVHNLIHVCDDVRKLGALDNYSAFKFENYMGNIKNKIKTGSNPLQQIFNRIMESNNRGDKVLQPIKASIIVYPKVVTKKDQIHSLEFKTFKLTCKEPNNCCLLENGNVALIHNFFKKNGLIFALMHKCTLRKDFFAVPCESSNFDIYDLLTDKDNIEVLEIPITNIKQKCIILKTIKDENVVLPILHVD
uniref:Uncharacterized protein n=1 Tax=Photinus pyralis TaxID=7054 RepID=A0A1Y1LCB4_PHOPY